MILHCDQCGFNLPLSANFCPICGANAPQVTRVKQENEKEIENSIEKPIFCPTCAEPGEIGHLRCTACGESFFIPPKDERQYCPRCSKRNSLSAKVCHSCGATFEDWWSLSGRTAEEWGHRGNLMLRETMTGKTYYFINTNYISFGRGIENQVRLPCTNISRQHCILDLRKGLLYDLDSTNGTWNPSAGKKISSIPLALVQDFNLAGLFTFNISRQGATILITLADVLDKEDVFHTILPNTDPDYFENMQHYYWIGGGRDIQLYIRKIDGRMTFNAPPEEDYYQLKLHNGFYYLFIGDLFSTNNTKLILQKYNEFWLPKNWQITIPENSV